MLTDAEELKMATPFGPPSGHITVGKLLGREIAFIPRHGPGHSIPPHRVNYRANVWAMKELGVTRLISISAVGSLKEEYRPGQLVLVDQFVDHTKKREYTFYEGSQVMHVSVADPFCAELRDTFSRTAEKLGLDMHAKGTYVCIEGPRFSTRAESRMFANFADIIGMTAVPETQLAREKEICYCTIAMVTDYDVWKEKPVDVDQILETMKANMSHVRKMLEEGIPAIPSERDCECKDALKGAEI
jgi:5'-methylthioadenosine phosphorylase